MILLYIYLYIEKEKVFYNIEGQLRGFQGSNYPKTYAPHFSAVCKIISNFAKTPVLRGSAKNFLPAKTPALPCELPPTALKKLAKVP